MRMLFSPPTPVAAPQPVAPDMVYVSLSGPCLATLRKRLEIDIDAKARGWVPMPFTLFELLELERILFAHADREVLEPGDNLLISDAKRLLLATYAARYRRLAQESDDLVAERVYSDLLDALLDYWLPDTPTPYSFSSHVRFSAFTRPLAVLRTLLGALLTRHRADPPIDSGQSKTKTPAPMAMNLQAILDSGEVEEGTPAELLEQASVRVDMLIEGLQSSNWGAVGEAALRKYQALAARIIELQNSQRGLDGMTPLSA